MTDTDTLVAPALDLFGPEAWDLPRHAATVREIIVALDPLLEAVRLQLGAGADRETLLDQLRGTLGFSTREASLPLAHIAGDDTLRRDLAVQAREIGDYIIAAVREVSESGLSLAEHGEDGLKVLTLRSHCDGHLWLPPVTLQLTGAHGGPHVMQLYNEWLHQIVLLRDSLIPFANWHTLPIPLHRIGEGRGLRGLEEARRLFVGDLLTKRVQHGTVLLMAQALFGLDADEQAYGFASDGIVVLPGSVGEPVTTSRKGLLAWREDNIAGLEDGQATRFRPAHADYLAQPRSAIGAGSALAVGPNVSARLEAHRFAPGEATVDIVVRTDRGETRVDLGQALRGHRFSYRPAVEDYAVRFAPGSATEPVTHSLEDLFALPAIAEAKDGVHLIALSGDPLVDLAVLGKIYPENTVIQGTAPWDQVEAAGKNYGAKFVLTGPGDRDDA